jgi:hypothetical protein
MATHQRALLFFHHIYSERKRAVIRAEARRLGVSGLCKIGKPGVLIAQGDSASVKAYLTTIKVSVVPAVSGSSNLTRAQGLRWQSCEERRNDLCSDPADFGGTMTELAESKHLAERMLQAPPGWHAWWMDAMGFHTKGPKK